MRIKTYLLLTIGVFAAAALILINILYFRTKGFISDKKDLLLSGVDSKQVSNVDFSDLNDLPFPVKMYFENVLKDGQKIIKSVKFKMDGELKFGPEAEEFIPFSADQLSAGVNAGFVWNSKIVPKPPIHIRVVDSYVNGKGGTKVILQSIFNAAEDKDNEYINQGALYRYLAEGVIYPTSLLPQNGVKWKALGTNTAIASYTDNGITVSMKFTFKNNQVISIYTEDRYGLFHGKYEKKPWEVKVKKYKKVDGMLIPSEAEVGWHLDNGFWLFLKAGMTEMKFDYL